VGGQPQREADLLDSSNAPHRALFTMKQFKPYLITAALVVAVIFVVFRVLPEKARLKITGGN
jgi:hypothetical protein